MMMATFVLKHACTVKQVAKYATLSANGCKVKPPFVEMVSSMDVRAVITVETLTSTVSMGCQIVRSVMQAVSLSKETPVSVVTERLRKKRDAMTITSGWNDAHMDKSLREPLEFINLC